VRKQSSRPAERPSSVRAEKLQALTELTRRLTSVSASVPLFAEIARAAATLLDASAARVWIDDPTHRVLRLQGSFGIDRSGGGSPDEHVAIPYGGGLVGRIFESRQPAYIEDIAEDPRLLNRRLTTDGNLHGFAGWPLLAAGKVVGVLVVLTQPRRRFTDEEQHLLGLLTGQAAIAIANATHLEEVAQQRHEAEELARVAALLTESLDVDSVTARVVESVLSLFSANSSALYLLEADGSARALAWGGQGLSHFERNQRFPRGAGVIGRALMSGAPVWSKDVLDDGTPVPDDMRRRIMAAGNRAVLAVPMRAKGRIIGGLSIAHDRPREFAAPTIALLQTFADQAALALENARLYDETERRRREAEELARFARVLTETLDLKALGTRIVESALLLFAAAGADLRMAAPDGSLVEVASAGPLRQRFDDLLAGAAIRVDEDLRRRLADFTARGVLSAPLRAKGKVIAVLSVADATARVFSSADVLLLETFADHAAVAMQNAQLYEEAQRAYDELSRAQAQLVRSETLRAIGEVASGAAHHLNNLLGIIAGRTELLIRRLAASDHLRSLETVNRAALDAAEVVRRIRSFSRAHTTPLLESLDLNKLVQEIVELTRPRWFDQAQRQGVRIDVTVEPGAIPPIAGEAAALREVLMNLLLNAIDALPTGGAVTLRTWRDASGVSCAVSDTGTGMSPEVQRRALEPFFTTKGPKSTGLGLSVNYGIIGAHGGTMAIASMPGRGTTVTFTLPPASGVDPARAVPAPALPRTSLRILVIDDDVPIREVIADFLREDGHHVEEAGHGRDGLARMGDGGALDLVITDLGMPEVTGWDVIRAAKEHRPPVPIGLVTGWGDDPDGRPADCERPDFVLAKPVTHAALRMAVGRVTGRLAT
jgi:signal transduction histidine kinase